MERVELLRECEAVQIPAGNAITLEKGVEVFITQSLGGTFTLQVPAYNGLYRIAGKDADAIGKTAAEAAATTTSGGDLEAMVWDQLKTCYDPEIPVNIVDLGLVYGLTVDDANIAIIDMTLTSAVSAVIERSSCSRSSKPSSSTSISVRRKPALVANQRQVSSTA